MHSILQRLRYISLVLPALVLLLFANVGSSLAAGTPVTVTLALIGGVLTAVPSPVSIGSNLTIGSPVTYSIPIVVTDTTGTGNGWHLTITSTQFKSLSGKTLPTSASSINSAPAVTCLPLVCVAPVNNVGYPVLVPASPPPPPPAVSFFNAAVNSGMGVMTVTPTITVTLPPTTLVDVYTRIVTLDIISGP